MSVPKSVYGRLVDKMIERQTVEQQDVSAKDVWVTRAGRLGYSVGRQSINIINSVNAVVRQVMCKSTVDIFQRHPCALLRMSRLVQKPEVKSIYTEHTFCQLYRGSHSYYMDDNSSKWRELQQTHMDTQSTWFRTDHSSGSWQLVVLRTRRGTCRRRWRRRGIQYIVEMNITDIKKLQLLTPGIAMLQTGRLMDKASCWHCQLTS